MIRNSKLLLYNTLSSKKDVFNPLKPPFVGMYVCGPTVYNEAHLGNCRTFVAFDVLYRYLKHLGYKVRYVRNITDVGHMTNDDEEEDKIARQAHIERVDPMQVVQRYTNNFHTIMAQLNNLMPDIEPTATGHMIEQIDIVKGLIKKGLAYEINGSVYFDIETYNHQYHYGELSGRILADLISGSRDDLKGQSEKRSPFDFALWKKVSSNHLMRWSSPWGLGFPGWHLECSAMSQKYLGETFDIHGGGIDLQFPHHECEIAQSKAFYGKMPAQYWIHTNMLTLNNKKMSKSDGNVILPQQLFKGTNDLFTKPYSQMVLRFAMHQTHYRSTMDINESTLQAAQKGYQKLMNGLLTLERMSYPDVILDHNSQLNIQIENLLDNLYNNLNDDLNTVKCIANMFMLLKKINSFYTSKVPLSKIRPELFNEIKKTYKAFTLDILGLKPEQQLSTTLLSSILDMYKAAKVSKAYDKVDKIRAMLKNESIILKDSADGVEWAYDEN